jgi:hypothetical protein
MKYKIHFICTLLFSLIVSINGVASVTEFNQNDSDQSIIIPDDSESEDLFGFSISISDNEMVVGSCQDDDYGENSGSVYIFKRSGKNWAQHQKLYASNAFENDFFGHSVSISGDYIVVGAPYHNDESGTAYVFKSVDDQWQQHSILKPNDPEPFGRFGYRVSISGTYIIIGADRDDENGENSGAAYIFVLNNNNWIQQTKLLANDGKVHDGFGHDVSIHNEYAIVGAFRSGNNEEFRGSAYIYKRDGDFWYQRKKLVASDDKPNNYFGACVSIYDQFAIVGRLYQDTSTEKGSAYVYINEDNDWTEHTILLASDGLAGDRFGASVHMNKNYAIVGATGRDDINLNSGAAYIYQYDGQTWVESAKLFSYDNMPDDQFGGFVSMSGNDIIVSSVFNNDMAGAVYHFDLQSIQPEIISISPSSGLINQPTMITITGANFGNQQYTGTVFLGNIEVQSYLSWTNNKIVCLTPSLPGGTFYITVDTSNGLKAVSNSTYSYYSKLLPEDCQEGQKFGMPVSMHENYAIIGAYGDNTNGEYSGAAYIFKKIGLTWVQEEKLIPPDCEKEDYFGLQVSIHGDYAVIGAHGDDDMANRSGAAYVYQKLDDKWVFNSKLKAKDAEAEDYFGTVSIYGDYIIIGAPEDDDNGNKSGAVYIFQNINNEWKEIVKLHADDASPNDKFGWSVSIHDNKAIVGAHGKQDNTGAAYVFLLEDNEWIQDTKLVLKNGTINDYFGLSVSIQNSYALIGAYGHENSSGAAVIYKLENDNWIEQTTFFPDNRQNTGEFGKSVFLHSKYAMIGEPQNNTVYLYKYADGNWGIYNKFNPVDTNNDDLFGWTACICMNDYSAMVGSFKDDDQGLDSGSVYVYDLNVSDVYQPFISNISPSAGPMNGKTNVTIFGNHFGDSQENGYVLFGNRKAYSYISWSDNKIICLSPESHTSTVDITVINADGIKQVFKNAFAYYEKIHPHDPATDDRFGNYVSISDEFAIVGSYWDDDNGSKSGSAYIFNRQGHKWVEHAKIKPSDGEADEWFAWSVAIDANYALVGCRYDNEKGSNSGSAYIFKREGNSWVEQQKLSPDDGGPGDEFGESVSISGNYAVISAYHDNVHGERSGAAYVFKCVENKWFQQEKLYPETGAAYDIFGESVAIHGDYIIVGASGYNENGTGAAYIFKRDGNIWNQQAKLLSQDNYAGNVLGYNVSIYQDYAMVGAVGVTDNGFRSGAAFIFKRDGEQWTEQAKIVPEDNEEKDHFGRGLCIYKNYAVIGAGYDNDKGEDSGSLYVFKRENETWKQQTKLVPNDGASEDLFGLYAAMSGDYIITSSLDDDDNGDNTGSAYIFNVEGNQVDNTDTKLSIKNAQLAFYPFDYQLNNLCQNIDHATVEGDSAQYTLDRSGTIYSAFEFTGNNWIHFPQDFIFNQPTDATLMFWIKSNDITRTSILQSRDDDVIINNFSIVLDDTNNESGLSMFIEYVSSTGKKHTLFEVPFEPDQWTHITMTRNDNTYELFKNGQLIGTTTDNTPDLPENIGKWFWGKDDRGNFVGVMDDIRIFDRALSDSEIQFLYHMKSPRFIEIQSIPTTGAGDWDSFTIGKHTYIAVSNLKDNDRSIVIYQWNGVEFEAYQVIPGSAAQDLEVFHFNGNTYLTLGSKADNQSKLYKWDGEFFQYHLDVPANCNMGNWETFLMNGEAYIAVANAGEYKAGEHDYTIDSVIYKFSGTKLEQIQKIATSAGISWEYFSIADNSYLALNQNYDQVEQTYNNIAKIFMWKNTKFELIQNIQTSGGNDWEHFTINDTHYLVLANYYDDDSHYIDSKIYQWNGEEFLPFQNISTHSAVDWESFQIKEKHYLALASHDQNGIFHTDSTIYQWDGNKFQKYQNIRTDAANCWCKFTVDNQHYLVVANGYKDNSYHTNSKIYQWVNSDVPYNHQSISFPSIADKTYGDDPFPLLATASSGLKLTYTCSNPEVITINDNMAVITGAGDATITACQSGNLVYNSATPVQINVHVNKKTLIASTESITICYGEPLPDFKIKYAGFVNADTEDDLDVQAVTHCFADMASDAGFYTIFVKDGEDSNYDFQYHNGTLVITPASQILTFPPISDKQLSDSTFELSGSSSSGLKVIFKSLNTDVLTIDGNTATIVGTGQATIVATQDGNQNYLPAGPVEQSFFVYQPINLNICSAQNGSIELEWDVVDSSENIDYKIYRSQKRHGIFYPINPVIIDNHHAIDNKLIYTDTNLYSESTYHYKIKAILEENTIVSNIVSATPKANVLFDYRIISNPTIVNVGGIVSYGIMLGIKPEFKGSINIFVDDYLENMSYEFQWKDHQSSILNIDLNDEQQSALIHLTIRTRSATKQGKYDFNLSLKNIWEGGGSSKILLPLSLTVIPREDAGIELVKPSQHVYHGKHTKISGNYLPPEKQSVNINIFSKGDTIREHALPEQTGGYYSDTELLSQLDIGDYSIQASIEQTYSSSTYNFSVVKAPVSINCFKKTTTDPGYSIACSTFPALESKPLTLVSISPDNFSSSTKTIYTDSKGYYEENFSLPQMKGLWQYIVYWMGDEETTGNESNRLHVSVGIDPGRVIILGGGEARPENTYWDLTQKLSVNAYRCFNQLGFTDTMIWFMINSDMIDINRDGKPDPIVDDNLPTKASLKAAITNQFQSSLNEDTPLIIYLMGHADSTGQFKILDSNEMIDHITLNEAITEIQDTTQCTVIVIIESCYSGLFIKENFSAHNRIMLTSAGNEIYTIEDRNGYTAFSTLLFKKILEGDSLGKAFNSSKDSMINMRKPEPWLDDNGDGRSNYADGALAHNTYIGTMHYWHIKPEITEVQYPVFLDKDISNMEIKVQAAMGESALTRVWAQVIPSVSSPLDTNEVIEYQEITLLPTVSHNQYTGTINNLYKPGVHTIVLFAQDNHYNISDPEIIYVNVTGLSADINGDGSLNLKDIIMVMQHLSGIDVTNDCYLANGDINNDNKIGIQEVIYLLQVLTDAD